MGHRPIDHRILSNNSTRHSLHAIFDGEICRCCKMLDQCPVRTPNHRDRGCHARDTVGDFRLEITPEIRLRDEMYSIQQTNEWKDRYRIRSGIEATNSELKRSHGLGRLRVRRATKVCFAVACKLTACNIKRWTKAHLVLGRLIRAFIAFVFGPLKRCELLLTTIVPVSTDSMLRMFGIPSHSTMGTYFSGVISLHPGFF